MTEEAPVQTCPRCGERLETARSRGRVSFGSEIRMPVACPSCAAPLEIVVQPGIPDEIEVVSVWAEDRRDGPPGGEDT